MDSLLPQLLAFPPHPPPVTPLLDVEYDRQIKSLLQSLKNVSATKLTENVPSGGNLLDIIDPSINSLSYLFVLLAHSGSSSGKQKVGTIAATFTPGSPVWQKMLDFTERFDPVQIRYSGNELRRLIDIISTKARMLSQPMAAIIPIRSAILRLDPSSSTLSSSHLILVRLCLEARAFSAALPVIDLDIYHFPATSNKAAENSLYPFLCSNHESSSTFFTPDSALSGKLNHWDCLQYFLYSAMIYMGLKDWKKAHHFLEIVLTYPVTNNASKIQVEAYKKWVLVSLLYRGCILPVSGTTSSPAAKQIYALGKPYDALAEVFSEGIENEESVQKLLAEASAARQVWSGDHNTGLVKQVIEAFRRYSVLQLERTFTALTIAEVTRRTTLDPNDYAGTGKYMLQLISSGQLNAGITQPSEDYASWVVRFSDPTSGPLARSEEQQLAGLVKQNQKIEKLMGHIREADRKLSLSKEYIGDLRKKKKQNGDGGVDGSSWLNQPEGYDQDEDMMADM